MDLTSRLLEHVPPPKSYPKWPVLAFAAGAMIGVVAVIGGFKTEIERFSIREGEPIKARLIVQFGSKMIHNELGSDTEGMRRREKQYLVASLCFGLVGGGIIGLIATAVVGKFFQIIYPTDVSMMPVPDAPHLAKAKAQAKLQAESKARGPSASRTPGSP